MKLTAHKAKTFLIIRSVHGHQRVTNPHENAKIQKQ